MNAADSMSAWMVRAAHLRPALAPIANVLLAEEARKPQRLEALGSAIDLPVYETRLFDLPADLQAFRQHCAMVTHSGRWRLALRLSRRGAAFVRQLDIDAETAVAVCDRDVDAPPFVAAVTPYRSPDRSGTLLVQETRTVLELSMGPHTWISKGNAPSRESVVTCLFEFPWISIRYSTHLVQLRQLTYKTLRDSLALVTGQSIRELSWCPVPVYAEFHWHAIEGYRFIECSWADVWTR
jgi:hypothetical protein